MKLTFRRLQANELRVFALAGAVEGLHAGVVHRVEVQPIDGADCLFSAVHFLWVFSHFPQTRIRSERK